MFLKPGLHEQIKHAIIAQIRPELLHTDREFEQLKEVLFAHVNAAIRSIYIVLFVCLFFVSVFCMKVCSHIFQRILVSSPSSAKLPIAPLYGSAPLRHPVRACLFHTFTNLPTCSRLDNTFWGVGTAAVRHSWLKANMVAQGHGKFGP